MSIFLAQGHIVQLEAVLEAQRKFWRFVGAMALRLADLPDDRSYWDRGGPLI